MKRSTALLLVPMIVSFGILVSLGTWQVQRLHWKENLIDTVTERLKEPPVSLEQIEAFQKAGEDFEYLPMQVQGEFDHTKEQYYYVTKNGVVGWHVYAPLKLSDGRILIVNRGFVPDKFKSPEIRKEGLVSGVQELVGLARTAPPEKPNGFVPENDLKKNVYYWKSLKDMADQMSDGSKQQFLPFFMDAGLQPETGPYPHGGTTRISFPNNHLQYAVTWYGLALALLGVGGYFLYQRSRKDI